MEYFCGYYFKKNISVCVLIHAVELSQDLSSSSAILLVTCVHRRCSSLGEIEYAKISSEV